MSRRMRREMRHLIDLRQLRALLAAYLRMSLRGKSAGTFFRAGSGTWRGTIALVLVYTAIGTAGALGASGSRSPFSYALVMHTITFVMLGMSLAAESGDLLFHRAEHEVLGQLPLAPRTLLVAKAASLMGFALLLAFSINLPAVLLGVRVEWLPASFAAAHLGAVVLLTAFVAAILVFSYGLVVRFVDRERFDNVAAWSQAGLSAAFLALSQGLAHLVELPILRLDAPFCLVFPPAWFAALEVLGPGQDFSRAAVLSLLGVSSTAVLAGVAVTRLAPSYSEALARLGEARAPRTAPASASRPDGVLARWWLPDPVERAAFRLAAAYMRRDREVKTRLYPSLGFFLLLPVAQLLGHAAFRFRAAAVLAVLLLGMLPSMVLETLRVSSHHAAAELFAVAPLGSAGRLFLGVRKAAVYYLLVPATAASMAWVVFLEPRAFPLVAPGLLALPVLSLLPAAFRDYVPLSVPAQTGRQSLANIVLGMINSVVGGALICLAWVAWRFGWLAHLLAAEAVLVALGAGLLARRIRNRPLRAAA
jgi:hypothetical protein